MAGKPELSVAQPPGVQNVVVYVSNDNFAQAYAVGQQNVAAFSTQASVSQQNTVVYANSGPTHSMAPMAKGFINKPLKATEFNGVVENGAVAQNFYACNTSPFIAQNGFQQQNIATYNNVSHMGVNINQPLGINSQTVPMLNNTNFDSVKNVIEFSASELYEKPNVSGRSEKVRDESVTSETFITDSGYVVMGEVTGQNVFPRCDSVRSETAESCSSLSSGDSQGEGGVVLMSAQATSQPSDVVMYDNSVRPGQLGNLVLTMVPPGPGNVPAVAGSVPNVGTPGPGQPSQTQTQTQAHIISVPNSVTTVTVPLGWKRIVTKGIVIYIR